jgi:hypothetical protein
VEVETVASATAEEDVIPDITGVEIVTAGVGGSSPESESLPPHEYRTATKSKQKSEVIRFFK